MNQVTEVAATFFENHYRNGLESTVRFVSKKGGTYEDAKDILHDALIIVFERLRQDNEIVDADLYLQGVVKNLWYKRVKVDLVLFPIEESDMKDELPAPTPLEEKLLLLLERGGKKCMDLLTAVYFSGNGITEVKKKFGFSSEHSASVQKYKCIEKLKETVKENSLTYEDFLA